MRFSTGIPLVTITYSGRVRVRPHRVTLEHKHHRRARGT